MTKYHINSKGKRTVCEATVKPCRFVPISKNNASSPSAKNSSKRTPVTAKPTLTPSQVENIVSKIEGGWSNFELDQVGGKLTKAKVTVDGVQHTISEYAHIGGHVGGPGKSAVIVSVDGTLWKKAGQYNYNTETANFSKGSLKPVIEKVSYENKYYPILSRSTSNSAVQKAIENGPGWEALANNETVEYVDENGNPQKAELIEVKGGNGTGYYSTIVFSAEGDLLSKEGFYSFNAEPDEKPDYSEGMLDYVSVEQTPVSSYEEIK